MRNGQVRLSSIGTHTGYPTDVIEVDSVPRNKRIHPTQKPIELLKWLISSYSNGDAVVLDPFSGSGSTAIACVETGRQCIGIEKEREYYDRSMERIELCRKQ